MLSLAPEAIEWIAARTTLASPLQAIPLIFRSIEHLLVVMSRSSRSTFRPWEGQVKKGGSCVNRLKRSIQFKKSDL
ncbi:hypothetical protein CAL27_18590 [Bordetella genomosp. 1]|uniref:Uncharacterized protein n=1 Tax=Bordetella genomosp. 1 TaxID=1395607 RepID=A0ABX4EX49_9BORD|nr:hypothetical protein CAL27_18590 [Bordetella genomosp. 1]